MATITCPDCLSGSVKEGTPTGTTTTIHGLDVYVARPEGTLKGLIVFIPDIFGWEMSNSRLLADSFAKEGGFLVYLPNFMNGHIPTASDMHVMDSFLAPSPSIFTTIFYKPLWLLKFIFAAIPFLLSNKEASIAPKIYSFHQALRNDPEIKGLKIGSAGYCWGGKYTTLLCQSSDLVDAGFTAHPSKMKFPDEYEKVQKPLSIAIGDVDTGIKVELVREMKKLLEDEKLGGRNEVVIMPGAKHGFAVRADPKDEGQTKSAGEAKVQAIEWFRKWLFD